MYESITTDWLPNNTKRWPVSMRKRGFMFCTCFRAGLREKHSEFVNEVEARFRELLGRRGIAWASRYNETDQYFEVFTKDQAWMMLDTLSSERGYSVLSVRIKLIEERQS